MLGADSPGRAEHGTSKQHEHRQERRDTKLDQSVNHKKEGGQAMAAMMESAEVAELKAISDNQTSELLQLQGQYHEAKKEATSAKKQLKQVRKKFDQLQKRHAARLKYMKSLENKLSRQNAFIARLRGKR